jgi:hypothetical protein
MSAPILTLQNLVELQKQPSNVQVFLSSKSQSVFNKMIIQH